MLNSIAAALSKYGKEQDFIDLIDTNFTANSFAFPASILERESIKYFKTRSYQPDPKGLLVARAAISEYYSKNQTKIGAEHIVVTASTSESYNLIFNTFTQPGDEVLLPRPGYPLFEYLAGFNHLKVNYYDLVQFEEKGALWWRIDFESLQKGLSDRRKFIVVISPNNPTGAVFPEEELLAVAKAAKENGTMVISDEVFSEFVYSGQALPRIANIATSLADGPIVFTLNGISKMFALPDLKLAWIGVSGGMGGNGMKSSESEISIAKVVDKLETANDVFLNANYLSQSILPALFREGSQFTQEMVERMKQNRDLVVDQLNKANVLAGKTVFEFVVPQGGIHMWISLPVVKVPEEAFVLSLIEKQHVSVHPGYFYDVEKAAGTGVNIVISMLPKCERLAEGIKRLASVVGSDQL